MRFLILLLVACGPKASKPKYDTAKLAHELYLDIETLTTIAKTNRGNCSAMITALEPHVIRMQAHAKEAKRVQEDTELAKQLKKDVTAYDAQLKGRAEIVGADLGATYQACPDNQRLVDLIDRIPEL